MKKIKLARRELVWCYYDDIEWTESDWEDFKARTKHYAEENVDSWFSQYCKNVYNGIKDLIWEQVADVMYNEGVGSKDIKIPMTFINGSNYDASLYEIIEEAMVDAVDYDKVDYGDLQDSYNEFEVVDEDK